MISSRVSTTLQGCRQVGAWGAEAPPNFLLYALE